MECAVGGRKSAFISFLPVSYLALLITAFPSVCDSILAYNWCDTFHIPNWHGDFVNKTEMFWQQIHFFSEKIWRAVGPRPHSWSTAGEPAWESNAKLVPFERHKFDQICAGQVLSNLARYPSSLPNGPCSFRLCFIINTQPTKFTAIWDEMTLHFQAVPIEAHFIDQKEFALMQVLLCESKSQDIF